MDSKRFISYNSCSFMKRLNVWRSKNYFKGLKKNHLLTGIVFKQKIASAQSPFSRTDKSAHEISMKKL